MLASSHLFRTGHTAVSATARRNHGLGAALVTAAICVGLGEPVCAGDPPVIFEWQGTKSNVLFGHSIENVGDVDGGGKDDILIGARPTSGGEGAAHLYRGEDGKLFKAFTGPDLMGADVAKAGDLDADGVPDILVGSYGPLNAGRVEAFSYSRETKTWTVLWSRVGSSPGELIYYARAFDDVNGGGPDVLIGGYGVNGNQGLVALVDGMTGATIRSWAGSQADTSFGVAFDSAPDIDGDGKPEVLIGAPRFDGPSGIDAGRVFLYSGGKDNVLIRIWDGLPGDNLGVPIQRGPDVDGDGFDDMLVGSTMRYPFPFNDGAGMASIYSLSTGVLLKKWDGAAPRDNCGAIGRVGDANGDGVEDIAVGSPYHDGPSGEDTGRLDVYSGADLSRLLCTVHGSQAGEALGAAADSTGAIFAGDMNSDGYAELAVAAPYYDGAGLTSSGRVLVLEGDVHTPGVTKYGSSKSFCTDLPIPLSVTSAPASGNVDFAITAINVPIGSVGIPIVALQPADLQIGWVPVLVNLATPHVLLPPVIPTSPGKLVLHAPLPAGYVGPLVYMQFFFVDVAGSCAQFGGISGASNGLHF